MIVSVLVDFNDEGDFYRLTIETENKHRLFEYLTSLSNDVRYIEDKEERGRKDTGCRVLPDGSTILRCQWFGSKIGHMMRFETSPYKMGVIKKAVQIRD